MCKPSAHLHISLIAQDAECLAYLGISFRRRFQHLGGPADLGEEITANRRPSVSPQKVILTSVGTFLLSPRSPTLVRSAAVRSQRRCSTRTRFSYRMT